MKPVKTVFNKSWIPYKNRVDFFLGSRVDFDAPVTTVHGFFFNEKNQLLMIEHRRRGWEIPGGHIDDGEEFETAMRRELLEETQMKSGALKAIGYLEKTALEDEPENCQYPYPLSYCIFYAGRITSEDKFQGDDSIIDSKFLDIKESKGYSWIKSYDVYLEQAIRILTDL